MENLYDVLIIGSGPSGMTSAIYSKRANLNVAILERGIYGGQLMNTEEIENYPSYSHIKGSDLAESMYQHMKSLGVEYLYGNVVSIKKEKGIFTVTTTNSELKSKAVIIGTGTRHLPLNVINEDTFTGRGVSYCAVCDGAFYKEKDIIVVGGGDSAVEEAIYLTQYVNKVDLLVRSDSFKAQPILVNRLLNNPKIKVHFNTEVTEFIGTGVGFNSRLSKAQVINNKTMEKSELLIQGAFIYVGMKPNSQQFENISVNGNEITIVDSEGYILTNVKMETSIKGLYAIGDVRNTPLRQVITACSDGSIASQEAFSYIQTL